LFVFLVPASPLLATTYTISVTAQNGNVVIEPNESSYEEGTTIKLIPLPAPGYRFSGWSGDVTGGRLIVDVTMNSNKSVTASFTTWDTPVGIPSPAFGISETYRMYDNLPNRNGDLTYTQNSEGGYYTHYIDWTDVNATDVSNPYGSVAKPRYTVPADLPAGSVVEIHGGPYASGGLPYGLSWTWFSGSGTASHPIFIRGLDSNPITFNSIMLRPGGSYIIIENLKLVTSSFFVHATKAADHISIRRNEITAGLPANNTAIWAGASQSFVAYSNYIHDNGDWEFLGGEANDFHGFGACEYARNLWVVDNYMCRNAGDDVQVNSGAVSLDDVARYVYVGRNVLRVGGENAVDLKQCADVIMSENVMGEFVAAIESDGTAIVINDDYPHENLWVLNNEIYDSVIAVRAQDSCYILGNVMRGLTAGIISYGVQGYLAVIGNTLYDATEGMEYTTAYAADVVILADNIMSGVSTDSFYIKVSSSVVAARSTLMNNLFYSTDGPAKFRWGYALSETLSSLQYRTGQGQGCIDSDPLFVNVSSNDFHLQLSSPAKDAGLSSGAVNTVYSEFENLYGISIRKDMDRRSRPQGSEWDIGAYERSARKHILMLK